MAAARGKRLGILKCLRALVKWDEGLALYSASRPVQVRGEEPPRSQNCKKSTRGPVLRGLLDRRVALNPLFWRLLYGFGPFKGSVRHALRSFTLTIRAVQ
jgi:hypothetical protein